MYALMMRCRAGTSTLQMSPLGWVRDLHEVTVSAHETVADAWAEADRLRPRGFSREQISFSVRRWDDRRPRPPQNL
jgi:hypothetical protein